MGAEGGREAFELRKRLLSEPWRFDFFQAVRLWERFAREEGRAGAGPGRDSAPEREAVRFVGKPSLAFGPSPVAALKETDGPAEMAVSFLGLVGASGVLPHHYTSLILSRLRDKDETMRRFFDLFAHRLVSFFHRAWEKYRLPFSHERAAAEGGDDASAWALYCFAGMGTEGLRGRLAVPDSVSLFYAGHFSHAPRNASGLEAMLAEYFGLPLAVEQMVPRWLALDEGDRAKLGKANTGLREGIVVGRRVRDLQGKFRIRIGPVRIGMFRRLMPDGDMLRPLWHLARLYVGAELDFDV
ncbi:MAG: type VI secretion system baseplate subunit TssG, partial [Gemmataceae bacterium]|nr:type VI secretion system baseplate subunit TssG [Gemmataceae bacterium]